jgi:nicotinamidase-related amidase
MPTPTLIVIDVQHALDDPSHGERSNPDAERNIARAIAAWREAGAPVIHIRHESEGLFAPGSETVEVKPEAVQRDGEPVLTKSANSAFVRTDLERRLRADGVEAVAIVGLTTDHCVSATTRMASDLGFETWVLADATAAHERRTFDGERIPAETIHRTALASLHDEFAEVLETDEALARVAGASRAA